MPKLFGKLFGKLIGGKKADQLLEPSFAKHDRKSGDGRPDAHKRHGLTSISPHTHRSLNTSQSDASGNRINKCLTCAPQGPHVEVSDESDESPDAVGVIGRPTYTRTLFNGDASQSQASSSLVVSAPPALPQAATALAAATGSLLAEQDQAPWWRHTHSLSPRYNRYSTHTSRSSSTTLHGGLSSSRQFSSAPTPTCEPTALTASHISQRTQPNGHKFGSAGVLDPTALATTHVGRRRSTDVPPTPAVHAQHADSMLSSKGIRLSTNASMLSNQPLPQTSPLLSSQRLPNIASILNTDPLPRTIPLLSSDALPRTRSLISTQPLPRTTSFLATQPSSQTASLLPTQPLHSNVSALPTTQLPTLKRAQSAPQPSQIPSAPRPILQSRLPTTAPPATSNPRHSLSSIPSLAFRPIHLPDQPTPPQASSPPGPPSIMPIGPAGLGFWNEAQATEPSMAGPPRLPAAASPQTGKELMQQAMKALEDAAAELTTRPLWRSLAAGQAPAAAAVPVMAQPMQMRTGVRGSTGTLPVRRSLLPTAPSTAQGPLPSTSQGLLQQTNTSMGLSPYTLQQPSLNTLQGPGRESLWADPEAASAAVALGAAKQRRARPAPAMHTAQVAAKALVHSEPAAAGLGAKPMAATVRASASEERKAAVRTDGRSRPALGGQVEAKPAEVKQARKEQTSGEVTKAEQMKKSQMKGEPLKKEQIKGEQAKKEHAKQDQVQREQAKKEQAKHDQVQREQAKKGQVQVEQAKKGQAKGEQAKKGQAMGEQAKTDQAKGGQAQQEQLKREQGKTAQPEKQLPQADHPRQLVSMGEQAARLQAARLQAMRLQAMRLQAEAESREAVQRDSERPRTEPFYENSEEEPLVPLARTDSVSWRLRRSPVELTPMQLAMRAMEETVAAISQTTLLLTARTVPQVPLQATPRTFADCGRITQRFPVKCSTSTSASSDAIIYHRCVPSEPSTPRVLDPASPMAFPFSSRGMLSPAHSTSSSARPPTSSSLYMPLLPRIVTTRMASPRMARYPSTSTEHTSPPADPQYYYRPPSSTHTSPMRQDAPFSYYLRSSLAPATAESIGPEPSTATSSYFLLPFPPLSAMRKARDTPLGWCAPSPSTTAHSTVFRCATPASVVLPLSQDPTPGLLLTLNHYAVEAQEREVAEAARRAASQAQQQDGELHSASRLHSESHASSRFGAARESKGGSAFWEAPTPDSAAVHVVTGVNFWEAVDVSMSHDDTANFAQLNFSPADLAFAASALTGEHLQASTNVPPTSSIVTSSSTTPDNGSRQATINTTSSHHYSSLYFTDSQGGESLAGASFTGALGGESYIDPRGEDGMTTSICSVPCPIPSPGPDRPHLPGETRSGIYYSPLPWVTAAQLRSQLDQSAAQLRSQLDCNASQSRPLPGSQADYPSDVQSDVLDGPGAEWHSDVRSSEFRSECGRSESTAINSVVAAVPRRQGSIAALPLRPEGGLTSGDLQGLIHSPLHPAALLQPATALQPATRLLPAMPAQPATMLHRTPTFAPATSLHPATVLTPSCTVLPSQQPAATLPHQQPAATLPHQQPAATLPRQAPAANLPIQQPAATKSRAAATTYKVSSSINIRGLLRASDTPITPSPHLATVPVPMPSTITTPRDALENFAASRQAATGSHHERDAQGPAGTQHNTQARNTQKDPTMVGPFGNTQAGSLSASGPAHNARVHVPTARALALDGPTPTGPTHGDGLSAGLSERFLHLAARVQDILDSEIKQQARGEDSGRFKSPQDPLAQTSPATPTHSEMRKLTPGEVQRLLALLFQRGTGAVAGPNIATSPSRSLKRDEPSLHVANALRSSSSDATLRNTLMLRYLQHQSVQSNTKLGPLDQDLSWPAMGDGGAGKGASLVEGASSVGSLAYMHPLELQGRQNSFQSVELGPRLTRQLSAPAAGGEAPTPSSCASNQPSSRRFSEKYRIAEAMDFTIHVHADSSDGGSRTGPASYAMSPAAMSSITNRTLSMSSGSWVSGECANKRLHARGAEAVFPMGRPSQHEPGALMVNAWLPSDPTFDAALFPCLVGCRRR